MRDEEIKSTRELAQALIFVTKGFGGTPPAETSIPMRILQLCNEVERLDRASWKIAEERDEWKASYNGLADRARIAEDELAIAREQIAALTIERDALTLRYQPARSEGG